MAKNPGNSGSANLDPAQQTGAVPSGGTSWTQGSPQFDGPSPQPAMGKRRVSSDLADGLADGRFAATQPPDQGLVNGVYPDGLPDDSMANIAGAKARSKEVNGGIVVPHSQT